jgi:L-asparaginase / beta-aspartyl-peptidase
MRLAAIQVWVIACLVLGATSGYAQEGVAEKLKSIVQLQENAWNRGDIDGFMAGYWKSDKLTFSSGGETRRGWETTRNRYKMNYPDKATMGKLTFSQLEVEVLSDELALMLGDWKIEANKPSEGNFSLLWRRIEGTWVIVHDHSSSREK